MNTAFLSIQPHPSAPLSHIIHLEQLMKWRLPGSQTLAGSDLHGSHATIQAQVHYHSGSSPLPFGLRSATIQAQVRYHSGSSTLPFGLKSATIQAQVHYHSGSSTLPFGLRSAIIRAQVRYIRAQVHYHSGSSPPPRS